MANSYLEGLLGENERILLVTRQHWFILFSNILLEVLLTVALVVGVLAATLTYPMAQIGFILVLVPLAGMLRDYLIWSNRVYVVTNRRVIQISGVLDKDVVDSSLEKVNDVKMSQSFWGRLFDYGDIEILTASEIGVNLFRRIAEPVKFKTAMLNAKEELGFGEVGARPSTEENIPQLIAKLDDLRRQGIISETEFQKKKAELLAKL